MILGENYNFPEHDSGLKKYYPRTVPLQELLTVKNIELNHLRTPALDGSTPGLERKAKVMFSNSMLQASLNINFAPSPSSIKVEWDKISSLKYCRPIKT